MKHIFALGGISGAGKTTYRKRAFKNTAYVDIADVYRDNPSFDYSHAWQEFLERIHDKMEHEHLLVVEAIFTDRQRSQFEGFCKHYGYTLDLWWISVPKKLAIRRIKRSAKRDGDSPERLEARLRIADNVQDPCYNNCQCDLVIIDTRKKKPVLIRILKGTQ